MSYPPRAPSSTSTAQGAGRPPRIAAPQPSSDFPPNVDTSPRIPGESTPPVSLNSAQRYLQNREKKLFDSADYFSTSPGRREATPPLKTGGAFEQVEQEANRLSQKEARSSALSFEMFQEIEGGIDDDVDSASGEDSGPHLNKKSVNSMRRNSMEELFVEESEHETVKHAILEKPKLKRWDSGDFYSSPTEYRKMLATQAKDVLKQALEHAEEDCRPRRMRRSSLSMGESHNEIEDEMRAG